MGWTTYDRNSSPKTKAAEEREIESLCKPFPVLKALKIGSVWYVAVTVPNDNGCFAGDAETGTTCFVFLTSRSKGEWGYKDMDESVGPSENKCPESILRILSPLAETERNAYAIEWRERCAKFHNRPKPQVGDTVTFPTALQFGTSGKGRVFRKVNLAGYKSVFLCTDNPALGHVRLLSDQLANATITPKG